MRVTMNEAGGFFMRMIADGVIRLLLRNLVLTQIGKKLFADRIIFVMGVDKVGKSGGNRQCIVLGQKLDRRAFVRCQKACLHKPRSRADGAA